MTGRLESGLARELLDGLAEAIVTTGPAGLVTLVNATAGTLLPEVTIGTALHGCAVVPLANAVADGAGAFDGEHRGRRLHGVRHRLSAGRCAWSIRDVTDEWAHTDALLAERSRTAFLAEAGGQLGLSLHLEQTLRAAVTLPVPDLADAAIVVRRPLAVRAGEPGWSRFALGDAAPVTGPLAELPTNAVPGLAEALSGRQGDASGRLSDRVSDLAAVLPATFDRPGTLLTVPLVGVGGVAGALIVVRRTDRSGFHERDVDLVRQFASHAGAALAAAELYGEQAHLARVLQRSLLPPDLPDIAGVRMAGGYRAVGDGLRIGGDFYDVFPVPGGGTFALGDVCGRGVDAAVLTGRVRQSLHTLRMVEQRPIELIRLLNQVLLDSPDAARRNQFATLLLGDFQAGPDGGLRLRIAGGGHPAPLVARADRTVGAVPVGGMPVGAMIGARFAATEVRLAPGDLLLAYTDGVTAARGGPGRSEMFGADRLQRALASCAGLPPRTLVDRLLQLVDGWLDGQVHDDIAMLALSPAAEPAG